MDSRDLVGDALNFLAVVTTRSAADLKANLVAKTAHDLEQFWEALPLDRKQDDRLLLCHYLTGCLVTGGPVTFDQMNRLFAESPRHSTEAWHRLMTALGGVLPKENLPGLLLTPPHPVNDCVHWLHIAAGLLATLVKLLPSLPAAGAVDCDTLDGFLRTCPESHTKALVREGVIPVAELSEQTIRGLLQDQGIPSGGLEGQIRRLVAEGASTEVVGAFIEAVRSSGVPMTAEADEGARSAAEQFLFECLESLPQTAGHFELNGTLDFRFGPGDAEIDLLARDYLLAIEIDGYYHFRDPDAYRRDRRKDWELQRRGFLILRFLATDVVARMEEILDTILEAVELGRQRTSPERTSGP